MNPTNPKRQNSLSPQESNIWKKSVILVVLFCVLACLVGPVIINELYKLNYGYQTYFTPSDVLSFLGSVLSSIGSILLGVITVYQTNRANEMSRKLMDLEFKRYKSEHRPFVIVDGCQIVVHNHIFGEWLLDQNPDVIKAEIDNNDKNSYWLCIEFSLLNTSNSYELVSLEKVIELKQNRKNTIIMDTMKKKHLKPGERAKMRIYTTYSNYVESNGFPCSFSILLQNQFGSRYREGFEIYLLDTESRASRVDTDEPLLYSVLNYRIEKFISLFETIQEEI